MKKAIFLSIFLSMFLSMFLPGAVPVIAAESGITDVSLQPAADKGGSAGIDFETYQKNLDELYQVALWTNPDAEFGVNDLIVDLNRKIAANAEDAESLASLGHLYRMLGVPTEANRFYQKAIQAAPDDFHLNVFSAKMFFRLDNHEKALERINKALEINPLDAGIWVAKGLTLMRLGRESEAIESVQKALEIDPGHEEALFFLSILYQRAARPSEALQLLEKLAANKPGDKFVRYHLGALFLAQNKTGKAIEMWEGLFKEGIRAPQILFNLTVAYLDHGDYDKAEVLLNHLKFFYSREADVDFLIAEVYRRMGKLGEAAAKYREVIVLVPDYISAYVGLARVFEQQGLLQERNRVLQEANQYLESQAATLKDPQKSIEDLLALQPPKKQFSASANTTS
ncbi:MAG: hypothetical protein A2Z83_06750 [Omnitrophica bacterium GWA2_52_8]|nr:MAG: hypothetical protein A2Z83_06750 [Omnitrophica bacterium GWA2_52_8]